MATSSALVCWIRHLGCLVLPATTTAFLASGVQSWEVVLSWNLVVLVALAVDTYAPDTLRNPALEMPVWPFSLILYAMVMLQLVNIVQLILLARELSWTTPEAIATSLAYAVTVFLLVGTNSSVAGIIVAHELIHRKSRLERALGRVLLIVVFYQHFEVEHVRGHHARVATQADPATARYGEPFWSFYRRTVPQQFRSALHLDRALVLAGLCAQLGFAFLIVYVSGFTGLLLVLAQAWHAQILLEATNYFEHWGLVRSGRRVTAQDSWDTTSAASLYGLVGLARHSDHHVRASRPYHELQLQTSSPKLPYGYVTMIFMAMHAGRMFHRLMTEELKRRDLGPFAKPTLEQPVPDAPT